MKIVLIAIGQKIPSWAQTACDEYHKRFPSEWRVEIKTIKTPSRNGGKSVEALMAQEAERITATVAAATHNPYLVLFDEHGKQQTTMQLAQSLKKIDSLGHDIALVIGGPDGLDAALKKSARETWGLSQLTLPHAMARVLVIEQLYRAWSILANHPYHRE